MNKAAIKEAFRLNAEQRGEQGAALSIWQQGHELLQLNCGEARHKEPWVEDTLVPIYSATKCASCATLLLALARAGMNEDLEIGEIWPRFPLPHSSIAQLLSHQLGLAALSRPASIFDLDDCRAAIEQSRAAWAPPQHGYHPHTLGPIIDILMLELTGDRLCDYWEAEIRSPLELDFFIGLPTHEAWRVAELRAPRLQSGMPKDAFYQAFFTPDSPQYKAFNSITGIASAREMNQLTALQCGCPAKGGVASARGLAQFYQALMGHRDNSPFTADILRALSTPQSQGQDLTLLQETSFSCGAMMEPHALFLGGFGHAGAGGSHAFCLPDQGISFAYVMNQMEFGVLPGAKIKALLEAFCHQAPL